MSDIVVVDASLALKWVVREPHSEEAAAQLEAWSRANRPLLTPPLIVYEATNVLHQRVRRGEFSSIEAQEALASLLQTLAPTVQYVPGLAGRALALANQFGLSATYDSHYLALAEHVAGEFWTADRRLWSATYQAFPWMHWIGESRTPRS